MWARKGCAMKTCAIQLMALTGCLLLMGSGCTRAAAAARDGSDETVGIPTPQDFGSVASEALESDQQPPPSTPPEAAPSAFESSPGIEAAPLSPALQDVVQLLRSGVEDKVVLHYIGTSEDPFEVGSEAIIYLTDLGASGEIINAMMERDEQLRSGRMGSSSEPRAGEPWPPAGTVAEVPASGDASASGEETAAADTSAVPAEAADTVSIDYFHAYLAPYGTWVQVQGYGLCWQPTVAVSCAGWMPYGDRGRWVYTDHGWYWYSDYTWGWATFHYGRWFHHSRWGWCWVPGTVWGPSWVSWRYAGSYCGWAPLPPYCSSGFYFSVGISWGIPSWCYSYVPSYRICANHPRRYCISYTEALPIHRRSTLRNHYTVAPNHTIENRGIPPGDLSENPDRDIRRARIRAGHEIPRDGVRRERLASDGGTLTVYQPSRRRHATAMPSSPLPDSSGTVRRAVTASSPAGRSNPNSSIEPTARRSSRDSSGTASGLGATSKPEVARGQRTFQQSHIPPSRPARATDTEGRSTQSSSLSGQHSGMDVREGSIRRTTPGTTHPAPQARSIQRNNTPGTVRPPVDSFQRGLNRPNSQRATSTPTPTRIGSPDRPSTTSRATIAEGAQGRNRQPGSAVTRGDPQFTFPGTVDRGAPHVPPATSRPMNNGRSQPGSVPRAIHVAPAGSPSPSTVASGRSVPARPRGIASVPQPRTPSSSGRAVSSSPQRSVAPAAPARALSSPGASVRSSAPSVRSVAPAAPRATVPSGPARTGSANHSQAGRHGR